MDKSAVVAASDEQLRQLELRAQGDILALRVFCAKEQFSDDRKKLTQAIKTNKRLVGAGPDKKLKKVEKKNVVQLGCLHWHEKEARYKGVRSINGGCQRSVRLSDSSTLDDVLNVAKERF